MSFEFKKHMYLYKPFMGDFRLALPQLLGDENGNDECF